MDKRRVPWNYFVLTMAEKRLNQTNAARAAFASGLESLRTSMPAIESGDLGEGWSSVLIANILMREAKAVVEDAPAGDTAESSSATNALSRHDWMPTLARVPDTFCRQFLALGPFPTQNKPNWGLDEPFINEQLDWLQQPVGAAAPQWKAVRTPDPILDLAKAFRPTDNHLAYLAVEIRSDREQAAQARVGSDDDCKLWQSGKPILKVQGVRGAALDQNVVDITLRKGANLFLLKVNNRTGGWAAVLRFTDPQGYPLTGVEARLPVPRAAAPDGKNK